MFLFDFGEYVTGWQDWVALGVCAVLVGMSKTGIQGINTIVAPVLALVFGGKPSTGLLLPILCMADLIGVAYYRRHAEWKYILKLLPAAVVGFFVAIAVDRFVPDDKFRLLIGGSILISLGAMFWSERGNGRSGQLTSSWWFSPAFGLLGGFTTMIANAAGPVMGTYLLSMRLPKYAFVGTAAWFFLIVNYLKFPLQIFVWHNISGKSLLLDVMMLPMIGVGAVIGIRLVRRLPEKGFRNVIIGLTLLSALLLFF
ncbi:MAG: sulfite exporter TauE/SafE family protein [Rikenellaceae bacterium]|jgi:uncharacterized membrane protein YfcA|nr:sulfite exporter TauE/SafE family protein [Rikenellaceae bacterium]